jgi:predicted extracellular nuclease
VALADLNARSWLFLDDGSDAENPATVPYLGAPPPAVIRAGDTVSGLTGVLDYGQINSSGDRDYRLHPTTSPNFTTANARTSTPSSVGGSVSVASFNVLNYFVTLDGSGSICGPTGGQQCRGADSSSEFTRQRDKIIAAMCAINADVFGLMELENTNPSNDPNSGDGISNYVLLDLVNGLNDAGSACPDKTYTFIDSPAIGTDAIQVGIIYKGSTMTPVSGLIVLDDTGFLDPNNIGTPKNRPAQAVAFEDGNGERFSVVVNHLKSKGSSCGAGDDDSTTGQGNCNLTRTLAAAYQRDWIATDPTGSGDVDYLVIGDLNAYAQEDPIMAFGNNGFLNLIETFEGANAYSYIFDGQSGYLDHAVAHSSFPAQVTGVTEWHINADEPSVINYDEYWNPAGYYSATPYRASDHDPVVIGLNLQPEVTGTINGIVESVTHNFPNGICGGITFTTLGSVDHVEVEYRQSHPSVNLDGLPRGYEIRAFDSGNTEVTTGFVADVMMCYADIELGLAGIDSAEEPNLHAYRYAGSDTWQEYSIVDTANNTVTAEAVTDLGHWGLGISTDHPTAVSLQNFGIRTISDAWVPMIVLMAGLGSFILWGWRRYQKGKHTA